MMELVTHYHFTDMDDTRTGEEVKHLLLLAARQHDLDSIEELWHHGSGAARDPWTRCSLLVQALHDDDIPIIRWLLEKGVDVNGPTPNDTSFSLQRERALFSFKSPTAFNLLLQRGLDLTTLDEDGADIWYYLGSLFEKESFFEMYDMMLEQQFQFTEHPTEHDLKSLLTGWINVDSELTEQGVANAKSLLARNPWWHTFKHMLLPGLELRVLDDLTGAAVGTKLDRDCLRRSVLQCLLDQGCQCNWQDDLVVNEQYGPVPDLNFDPGSKSATSSRCAAALHKACEAEWVEAIPALKAAGADIAAVDKLRLTPLHKAVANTEILEALLAAYPEAIGMRDRFGSTALHWAVCNNNIQAIAILLKAGADTTSRDVLGRAPFELPMTTGCALRVLQDPRRRTDFPEKVCSRNKNFFDYLKMSQHTAAGLFTETKGTWHEHHVKEFTERIVNSPLMGLYCPTSEEFLADYVLDALQQVMVDEHPILDVRLQVSGSYREGTVTGCLHEIDVIFYLNLLRDRYRVEKASTEHEVFAQLFTGCERELEGESLAYALERDGKLDCTEVKRLFHEHFDKLFSSPQIFHFEHATIILSHRHLYWDALLNEGSCARFTAKLYSADEKGLEVTIDVVLAIQLEEPTEVSSTPKRLLPATPVTSQCVVLKTGHDNQRGDWRQICRISVSDIDADIITKLPKEVRQGFMLLKAFNNSWLLAETSFLTTYMLKQAFLHCVEKTLADWQTDLESCDPDRLVKAHQVHPSVPPALDWAKHTLRYLEQAVADGHLPCYSQDDVELLRKTGPLTIWEEGDVFNIAPLRAVVNLATQQFTQDQGDSHYYPLAYPEDAQISSCCQLM